MNAVLMMPENEITSKLANHYRVVSGKAFKSIDTKEYEGENYICFTANSQADFIGGRCSSGKDQPFDKIPGIFETMMFDYAVDIAKYGQKYGVDYADVLIRNGDGNAQRGFNIDRDAVTFTGEVWDSNRFDAFGRCVMFVKKCVTGLSAVSSVKIQGCILVMKKQVIFF